MAITQSHAKLLLDQTEPQLHQTIQTDAEVVTMECQPIQFRCSETNDFRHPPFTFSHSWASNLPADLCDSISVLDDSSPRNVNRHTIGFAQIGDFKGLESEVILLVDMPRPGRSENLRTYHYVGMSRARALLSMICC